VRIDLQPFTLVGATTRLGLLTTPLRDRFGIPTRLLFYTEEELDLIVARGARLMGIASDPEGVREIADRALTRLGVDNLGLDGADRRYMLLLAEHYGGGPVGVETISAALSESRDAVEEVIEPYLLQQGLIQRTPRGRMLAARAWRHLGLDVPKGPAQSDLFEG
jgi:holliday junction DNA helicase RuvB